MRQSLRAPRGLAACKRWVRPLAAAVLFLLLTDQAFGSSAANSATFDEPCHLGAGCACLRTDNARLHSRHSPLVDARVALPLLLLGLHPPLGCTAWQQAEYGICTPISVRSPQKPAPVTRPTCTAWTAPEMPVVQGGARDGWGAAMSGLAPGDVIVQHVRIPVPEDMASGVYRLQVSLYAPDTATRRPVQAPDGTTVDRVWLPEVEVLAR